MLPFPIIILFFALLVLIIRPFTILFHELGHAIPALILTRQPVTVYIGSYGDTKYSIHFRMGRLDVWLKYNPLAWRSGLCIPSAQEVSINKKIIYTLTGPLASFIIAVIACYVVFAFDLHGSLKLIFIIFMGSAIVDLITNLNPNPVAIKLYDGSLTHNDGYQLKQLFYYRKLPKEYERAVALYTKQNYKEAAVLFEQMLESGIKHEDIFRLAISSFLQINNYDKAKQLSDELMIQDGVNTDDLIIAAHIYTQLGQYEQVIAFYDQSLDLDPSNTHALNNKGYILTLLEQFEAAIAPLDKVIEIDEHFAYAYNNRGLAKVKTGKEAEGLEDIYYAIRLDANNAYAYRNLGIYHLDRGAYAEALDLFKKAKAMDSSTLMIAALIEQAERKQG